MKEIEATNEKVDILLKIEERFNNVEKTHNLCLKGELKDSPYKNKK